MTDEEFKTATAEISADKAGQTMAALQQITRDVVSLFADNSAGLDQTTIETSSKELAVIAEKLQFKRDAA